MKNYSLHAPVWQQWKIAAFEWSSSSISTSLFLPLLRTLDLLLLVIALVKWNRSRGEHTRVSLLSVRFSEMQNRKASWLEHIEKGRCIETQWSMSADTCKCLITALWWTLPLTGLSPALQRVTQRTSWGNYAVEV